MPPRTLVIGKARPGKPEYFAKLDGSPSVFGIKKDVADTLTGGSLALMPLQLWNGDAGGLSVVEVQRGSDKPFVLKHDGGSWKITAPFQANADFAAVNPLASALAAFGPRNTRPTPRSIPRIRVRQAGRAHQVHAHRTQSQQAGRRAQGRNQGGARC